MFRAIAKSRYLVPGFLCFALAFVVGPVGVASGMLVGPQAASIAGVLAAVLGVLGLLIIASGLPLSIEIEEVDAQIRAIHVEIEGVEDVIGENVKALSSGLVSRWLPLKRRPALSNRRRSRCKRSAIA